MGFFQNLLETYEKCKDAAGIKLNDGTEVNENKMFLPIFHTTLKSQICIILDENGNFLNAIRDNKDQTIIIPCTENSSGRSGSTVAPHPLCDKLEYIGNLESKKTDAYLKQLNEWKDGNQKLNSIYEYLNKRTMIDDLYSKNIFKKDIEYSEDENGNKNLTEKLNESGKPKLIVKDIGVRFSVFIKDDLYPNVWEDKTLQQMWIDYMKSKNAQSQSDNNLFDYLNGKSVAAIAAQHPPKINLSAPNARLISCNSKGAWDFTFRGRFENQNEALIIDYEQSQKMHQALKWLISNYGYNVGAQSIIVWAVDENTDVALKPQKDSLYLSSRIGASKISDEVEIFHNKDEFDLFSANKSVKTEADIISDIELEIYADYSKQLKNYLQGYGKNENITKHYRKICIAILDAATTGRMSLTFYQELPEDKYIENIVNWHNDTSYYLTAFLKQKNDKGKDILKPIKYVGAPSFDDIIFATYGKTSGKDYDTLKKKIRKQLIECMFGNFSFPKNMVDAAVVRAAHPMSFKIKKWNGENDWKKSLDITCALIRKYYKQKKEEIQMELEIQRRDRDYLYGRLLAVADKLEQVALYKANKNNERATNAVRLMGTFYAKPNTTWLTIYQQIVPYRTQLDGATWYQTQIDEIMALFKENDYENNSPLSALYLLGYSAQLRALSKSKEKEKKENIQDVE